MPTPTRRQLLEQAEKLEPAIRDAFLRAVADVAKVASVSLVADLLAAGRLSEVPDVLGLNAARFAELAEAVRTAYAAGGRQGITELPRMSIDPTSLQGSRYQIPRSRRMDLRVSFDLRAERAESWLRAHSSNLVAEIVADQRDLVRAIAAEGMALGRNPRSTALDLVGRVGPTGRRTGGVVGLTSQQGQFVANARAELLSGNPAQMKAYMGRTRRDKRFDAVVKRAIAAGKPVAPADVDRMAGRYADRLLQLRGENIARTESLNAFNEAREEAFRQAVDAGGLQPEAVRKVWSATLNSRTRDAHRALNGKTVGLNDPFRSPTGARLLHPGDASLGAGAGDIVNCRCMVTYKVDQIAQAMSEAA